MLADQHPPHARRAAALLDATIPQKWYGDSRLYRTQGAPCAPLNAALLPVTRARCERRATTQAEGADVKEYLYKILVVGDIGTGKTSIIKRYVHNIFSQHYKSTVRCRAQGTMRTPDSH